MVQVADSAQLNFLPRGLIHGRTDFRTRVEGDSSGVGEDQTIVVNTVSGSELTGRYVFNAVDAGSGILEIVSESSVRTFIDIDCIVWVSKTAP